MAFVGSRMSNTLYGLLSARGFRGRRLKDFTDSCSLGSEQSVVGKQFTTTDTGLIEGNGTGVGMSIFVPESLIANTAYATLLGFGFRGTRLFEICQDFATALTQEALFHILNSTHTPFAVFNGVGVVDLGSITVIDPEWGNNITNTGFGFRFFGRRWPELAQGLARGGFTGYKQGMGTVAITGIFTGGPLTDFPPTAGTGIGPIPGVGVGQGVIT